MKRCDECNCPEPGHRLECSRLEDHQHPVIHVNPGGGLIYGSLPKGTALIVQAMYKAKYDKPKE